MPKRAALIVMLCVGFVGALAGNIKAQSKPVKRVFVFYELGLSSPAVSALDHEIRGALENAPFQIELYREYLETTLFPEPTTQREVREWYVHKYRDRRPDLIIALGASALQFIADVRVKAFSGVPVVFGGTDKKEAGYPKLDSRFTGVWEEFDPDKAVEIALRLQPTTKHLFVVGGPSDFDKELGAVFRNKLHRYENQLDITYLTNVDMPNLLNRLQHLPDNSVILYTHAGRDTAGTRFVGASQVDPTLARVANAPIFSPSDVDLGHGEIGGDLVSFRGEGKILGGMALKILNGQRPQDIPIVQGVNVYLFDWRAMRRWGFLESKLPPGSIVLNRPPAVWDSFKWYIIGSFSVIVLEAALILGLLWQRTKRRSAESELVLASDRLRMAIEAASFVGWDVDFKSGQNRWFGDLAGMFGISSDTYSTKLGEFQGHVHPDDIDRVMQAIEDAKRTRRPYVAEFRVSHADGSVRWVAARGKFYYANSGVPARMLGLAVDITSQQHADELLRESEERFRLVSNTAPVMIWMSGPDKLYTYFNQPWLEFTGRCMEQERGNGWAQGLHPEDLGYCLQTYANAFDRREPFRMQCRLRRNDGEYRWVIDHGVPRFNSDGSFAGYIGSCIDVTQQKQAEEALSSISRRLIEAQEAERARIGRELHDDINQRLALALVNLQKAEQEMLDSSKGARRSIRQTHKQVSEIATDIQALSHQLHSSKLAYLGLVSASSAFCREFATQYNVQIHFHSENVPKPLPYDVSICLFRILQEALHNAMKHSGVVQYEGSLVGTSNEIQLRIHDNGSGFDIENAILGHGLGIVSMNERIKLVHGILIIESKPQIGTTILARVPLEPKMSPAKRNEASLKA